MTEKPAKDPAAEKAHRQKIERNKNRNLHSCKFPDSLEEDYQAWKTWYDSNITDNAALRHLISTHPAIQKHD